VPATPNCQNRSGRLIVYNGLAGGHLTVYNDGGIQCSTQHGQVFAREGLSVDELKELLAAFGEASFDTAPAFPDAAASMSGSRLLVAAARYQLVLMDLPPPALASVMTPEGAPEIVNRPILEYFGKTAEELKEWASTDAVHPDDLPRVVSAWSRAVSRIEHSRDALTRVLKTATR
jgi:hypothetical protein